MKNYTSWEWDDGGAEWGFAISADCEGGESLWVSYGYDPEDPEGENRPWADVLPMPQPQAGFTARNGNTYRVTIPPLDMSPEADWWSPMRITYELLRHMPQQLCYQLNGIQMPIADRDQLAGLVGQLADTPSCMEGYGSVYDPDDPDDARYMSALLSEISGPDRGFKLSGAKIED